MNECFGNKAERFIDGLMEGTIIGGLCSGGPKYDGWYPQLFYRTIYWTNDRKFQPSHGAGAFDALVADVHTDVPCLDCGGDPGSVLHEAVGRVNLLLLAVDNAGDCFICAGPVLSHYELEVTGAPRRLNGEEWKQIVSGDPRRRTSPREHCAATFRRTRTADLDTKLPGAARVLAPIPSLNA